QAADALFYGQLAQAQQAYKQGNISQALALSAPFVSRRPMRCSTASWRRPSRPISRAISARRWRSPRR
ncbi:hypothetical protein CQA65_30850, partial [Klebsiella pneumoniae]